MKPLKICCILLILSLFGISSAFAGSVTMNVSAVITSSTTETVTTDLNFGSIDLDPAGDTITIDASSGSASPVVTNASVVTGGTSGLITISTSVVMDVYVTYPTTDVTLSDGTNTLTLAAADILAYSQYGSAATAATTNGTTNLLIYVGGEIDVPANQASGTYSGTMTLTINYS